MMYLSISFSQAVPAPSKRSSKCCSIRFYRKNVHPPVSKLKALGASLPSTRWLWCCHIVQVAVHSHFPLAHSVPALQNLAFLAAPDGVQAACKGVECEDRSLSSSTHFTILELFACGEAVGITEANADDEMMAMSI